MSATISAANNATSTVSPIAAGSPPVRLLLKVEALGVFGLALAGYAYLGFSWWLFAALILAPDLSGIGYAGGTRLGAWCYDFAHTYVVPGVLAVLGLVTHEPWLMALASIWVAHISFDRVIGYGLKFSGSAKDTHLSRVG